MALLNELSVSQRSFDNFKAGVKQADGNVLLIVHPFFEENLDKHGASANSPEYLEYKKRLIDTMRLSKRPIVVMEEDKHKKSTQKRLNKLGVNSIVISTLNGNAIINTFDNFFKHKAGRNLNKNLLSEKEKIEPIAKLLVQLDARNIQLGGSLSYLENSVLRSQIIRAFESKMFPHRKVPVLTVGKGCLGSTYSRLINHHAKDFDKIRLMPHLCYPDKPLPQKPQEKKPFNGIKFKRKI
ncbi:MAG: hypothetical protein WC915_02245 [archaeon]|jgi:hypothetical protein